MYNLFFVCLGVGGGGGDGGLWRGDWQPVVVVGCGEKNICYLEAPLVCIEKKVSAI